jgi:hypothetical protein
MLFLSKWKTYENTVQIVPKNLGDILKEYHHDIFFIKEKK